jgi:hypothetical protein
VIEVTSDNGYGQVFTQKKNYEIRGLNDLFTGYEGEKIEPFTPITQITGPVVTVQGSTTTNRRSGQFSNTPSIVYP